MKKDEVSVGSELAGYGADVVQAAPEAVVAVAEYAGAAVVGTAAVAAAPYVATAVAADSVAHNV